MNVAKIGLNNLAFGSSNEEKKTSAGKWLGFGLGTGCIVSDIHTKGGIKGFADVFSAEVKRDLDAECTAALGQQVNITKLTTPTFKNLATWKLATATGGVLLGFIAAGAFVDWVINGLRD
ncbi:MAG: hypothetical protein PHC64_02870 [Candidatus Gastranaerophilales bacterium]|nr:hypothetical protein [Candidatus Gastranaerophilales bacterium]